MKFYRSDLVIMLSIVFFIGLGWGKTVGAMDYRYRTSPHVARLERDNENLKDALAKLRRDRAQANIPPEPLEYLMFRISMLHVQLEMMSSD